MSTDIQLTTLLHSPISRRRLSKFLKTPVDFNMVSTVLTTPLYPEPEREKPEFDGPIRFVNEEDKEEILAPQYQKFDSHMRIWMKANGRK